jgi:hypothetical protein
VRPIQLVTLFAAAMVAAPAPAAPPKAKIKLTVEFARSWDAAVAEGKLLNLPLVVHSHGFY